MHTKWGVLIMTLWNFTSLHGATLSNELPLSKVVWDVTWDFRERSLSPNDGKSSIAAQAVQAEDGHFVFFGWLGAIQAARNFGSPYVGFVIVSQDVSKTIKVATATSIEIEARTDSPDVHFDVLLEDATIQNANKTRGRNASHIASLKATDAWQTYRFSPSDFTVISRGVELQVESPVELSQIRRFGFQLRKSAQPSAIATATTRTPFRLEVRTVRWLP
jgi:hypothetical protein